MNFPQDFVWGVSAASYQIEGAAYEDGKGLSVWDMFCRRPGATYQGHNGDVACDHYHRYQEDVALLKALGAKAYRLSISWPRVLPEGVGRVNAPGLDFYIRLVDELLAAGVQPWVTLFHWDYPYALFCRGGWLNADSPQWFADYAGVMTDALSDRVSHWFTHNEPQCFISLGHYQGEHAPGLQLPLHVVLQAGHHALLAHGQAVAVIRARAKQPVKIGYAVAGRRAVPLTDRPEDIQAAREYVYGVSPHDLWNNTWWTDPVYLGRYPEEGLAAYGPDVPAIGPNDMAIIRQPLDFCCYNLYTGRLIRRGSDGRPEVVDPPAGYNRTSQDDWHVLPESIYWTTKWLYERYRLPMVITENGHQNLDAPMLDGKVHDPQRMDYTHRYLRQLERVLGEGVPVQGYFHWTLMDNFEWAFGYKVRVGLVYTNFQTLERIPKDSYYWYQQVIATQGRSLFA